ncbi:histone-lysine N-methyltransferase 2B-like isoform X2 [Scyliorhinus torazame]|uniref:histone-lysine N-methyltransferase 2B-like isoform X2 n=1 Tax=Scyliorhinus torazame TaxID=75743 RepID=UPI003B58C9DE
MATAAARCRFPARPCERRRWALRRRRRRLGSPGREADGGGGAPAGARLEAGLSRFEQLFGGSEEESEEFTGFVSDDETLTSPLRLALRSQKNRLINSKIQNERKSPTLPRQNSSPTLPPPQPAPDMANTQCQKQASESNGCSRAQVALEPPKTRGVGRPPRQKVKPRPLRARTAVALRAGVRKGAKESLLLRLKRKKKPLMLKFVSKARQLKETQLARKRLQMKKPKGRPAAATRGDRQVLRLGRKGGKLANTVRVKTGPGRPHLSTVPRHDRQPAAPRAAPAEPEAAATPTVAAQPGELHSGKSKFLKNIRQFIMPVVSARSSRVIKTPRRFIDDEAGGCRPAQTKASPDSFPPPESHVPGRPRRSSPPPCRPAAETVDLPADASLRQTPPASPPTSPRALSRRRTILRQPTFTWTTPPDQAESTKDLLSSKPSFDSLQLSPFTLEDVLLSPARLPFPALSSDSGSEEAVSIEPHPPQALPAPPAPPPSSSSAPCLQSQGPKGGPGDQSAPGHAMRTRSWRPAAGEPPQPLSPAAPPEAEPCPEEEQPNCSAPSQASPQHKAEQISEVGCATRPDESSLELPTEGDGDGPSEVREQPKPAECLETSRDNETQTDDGVKPEIIDDETPEREEDPSTPHSEPIGKAEAEITQSLANHSLCMSAMDKRMVNLLKAAKVQLIKIDQQKQWKSQQLALQTGRELKIPIKEETVLTDKSDTESDCDDVDVIKRKLGLESLPLEGKRARVEVSQGPRIKHVCRRAAVALGKPRAMVPANIPRLSALPMHERESIMTAQLDEDSSSSEPESPVPMASVVKIEREAEEVAEAPTLLPAEEETKPSVVSGQPKRRGNRCGCCKGCRNLADCGKCVNCLDKPKFGGRNTKKQCCVWRKCDQIELKRQERLANVRKRSRITILPAIDTRPVMGKDDEEWLPDSRGYAAYEYMLEAAVEEVQVKNGEASLAPVENLAADTQLQRKSIRRTARQWSYYALFEESDLSDSETDSKLPHNVLKDDLQSLMDDQGRLKPIQLKSRRSREKDRPVLLSKQEQLVLSPLSPFTNSNSGRQKGPLDGVHRIRVDFKEDCNIENVWLMGGLSVLSSVPILPRVLCLLCASQGRHEMVYCQVCCEPFHSFCLDEKERPSTDQKENWCCRRCKFCHVCGRKSKASKHLLECNKCRATYHAACLGPNYPTRPSKKRQTWVCPKCVRCKSCGATTPGRSWDAEWSYDFTLCNDCANLFEKGNYCPICTKCYEDNDYESKMMQCSKCDHWVHAKCEGVSDEMYEILSNLPDNIVYTCLPCMEGNAAEWQEVVTSELLSGLKQVLTGLVTSRLTSHLLKHKEYGEDDLDVFDIGAPCDLDGVKTKFEDGKYSSVLNFSDDVVRIIQSSINEELEFPDTRRANLSAKAYFMKQMDRIFPWFKVQDSKYWQESGNIPNGVHPNAVAPPSLDHSYALWREQCDSSQLQNSQQRNKQDVSSAEEGSQGGRTERTAGVGGGKNRARIWEIGAANDPEDSRQCALCLKNGDDKLNDAGRLLYIGQNEWTHVNCALWSAEVFEEGDGSLKNVHMAVGRGKLMRCEYCQRSGATVGCCLSSCQSNYHFMCARACNCVFEEDKKVYCQRHKDLVQGKTVLEDGFEVLRRAYVDFDGITLRKKFLTGLEPENISMMIGSMTIDSLGILSELSECEGRIYPVGYQCSRVYWSTTDAKRKCVYRCKIMEYHPPASESDAHGLDEGTNHTIVHSPSTTDVSDADAMEAAGKDRTDCPRSPERHFIGGQKAGPLPPPRTLPCSRIKTPSFPAGSRWSSGSSRPLPPPGSPASVSHHILTVSDPAISPNRRSVVLRRHSLISHHPAPRSKVTSPPRSVGATARAPATSHSFRTKDGISLSHQLVNASFCDGTLSAVMDRRSGKSESPCAPLSSAGKQTGLADSFSRPPGDSCPPSLPASGLPSPDPCLIQRNGLERDTTASQPSRGEEGEEEGSGGDGEIGRSLSSRKTGPGLPAGPRQQQQGPLKPKIVETYGQFGIRRMEASELSGRPVVHRRSSPGKDPLELPCPLSAAELLAPGFAGDSPDRGRGDAGEVASLLDDGDHPFDSIDIDIVSVLNSPNLLACGAQGETILTESYQDQTLHYGAQIIVGDQRESGTGSCKGKYPGPVELLAVTEEVDDGANTSDDDLDNYYNFARTVVTEEVMDQLASECFSLDGEVPRIDQLDGVDDSADRPAGQKPAKDGGRAGVTTVEDGTRAEGGKEGAARDEAENAGSEPLVRTGSADHNGGSASKDGEASPTPGKGAQEPDGITEELGNILPSEIMDFVLKNSSSMPTAGEGTEAGAALQLPAPPEARTNFALSLQPSPDLGSPGAKETEVDHPPPAVHDLRTMSPSTVQNNHVSSEKRSPTITSEGQAAHAKSTPASDEKGPIQSPAQDSPEERAPQPPDGDPHFPEPPQIQRVCANLAAEAPELDDQGTEKESPGGAQNPAPKSVILVNKHGHHMVILKSVQDNLAKMGKPKTATAAEYSVTKSGSPPGQGPKPISQPIALGKAPASAASRNAPVPDSKVQNLKTPLKLVAPMVAAKFPSDMLAGGRTGLPIARAPQAFDHPPQKGLAGIIQLSKPEVVYINQPTQQNYSAVLVGTPGPVTLLRPPDVPSLAIGSSILNVVSVQPGGPVLATSSVPMTGQLVSQGPLNIGAAQLLAQDCRGAVGNLVFTRREQQMTCIVPISQSATPSLVAGPQKVQVIPAPVLGFSSQQMPSSKPLDAAKVGSINVKTLSVAGSQRNSLQTITSPPDQYSTQPTSGLKHAFLSSDRVHVKKQKTSHIWVDQFGTERKVLEDLPKVQPPTSLGNGRVRIKTPTIKATLDLDRMEHLNSENTKSDQIDDPPSRLFGFSMRDSTSHHSNRRSPTREWKHCSAELSSEDESMPSTPREEEEEEEDEDEDDEDEEEEDEEEEEQKDEKNKENWRGTETGKRNGPHLRFEITSDDGFSVCADSIDGAWKTVLDKVLEARANARLKQISLAGMNGPRCLGLTHDAVLFLVEQLAGAKNCRKYKFRFHKHAEVDELPINPHGCVRAEVGSRKSTFDMFNFLASRHRKLPEYGFVDEEEDEVHLKSARRATSMDLPMAMRFRHLKKTSKEAVGVYRSAIHGRGLFCKRNIDAGEMVIEYSGIVIRSVLTDKREKYYDSKGIGCYMFRIDDFEVVDATMHGNAARFINHSCEPNCYSRVINVEGQKHIVIFAMRKIYRGEELTYDYKFPIEDASNKLPCNCGAKKCRRFLN